MTSGKFTRAEILEGLTDNSSIAILFKLADMLGGEMPDTFMVTATSRTVKIHIPVTYKLGETGKWTQNNVFSMPWASKDEVPS